MSREVRKPHWEQPHRGRDNFFVGLMVLWLVAMVALGVVACWWAVTG